MLLFANALSSCSWDFITNLSHVNNDYQKFLTLFLNKFSLSFPILHSRKTTPSKPLMINGLIKSNKHKKKLYYDLIKGKIQACLYIS